MAYQHYRPVLLVEYTIGCVNKVNGLRDTYEKKRDELEKEIPTLRELSQKIFEKENELGELRVELRRLETEMAAKVRETQMKAVPAEEAEQAMEEIQEDKLDHSENLRPIRFQTMISQDYPGEGLGR